MYVWVYECMYGCMYVCYIKVCPYCWSLLLHTQCSFALSLKRLNKCVCIRMISFENVDSSKYEGQVFLYFSYLIIPVPFSFPISESPDPSHSSSIPICLKAATTNFLTECISPVARTKSSGFSCCNINHIPST